MTSAVPAKRLQLVAVGSCAVGCCLPQAVKPKKISSPVAARQRPVLGSRMQSSAVSAWDGQQLRPAPQIVATSAASQRGLQGIGHSLLSGRSPSGATHSPL